MNTDKNEIQRFVQQIWERSSIIKTRFGGGVEDMTRNAYIVYAI